MTDVARVCYVVQGAKVLSALSRYVHLLEELDPIPVLGDGLRRKFLYRPFCCINQLRADVDLGGRTLRLGGDAEQ